VVAHHGNHGRLQRFLVFDVIGLGYHRFDPLRLAVPLGDGITLCKHHQFQGGLVCDGAADQIRCTKALA
jgi:hypothetical protein